MEKNTKVANMTKWMMPCKKVVRPVLKVLIVIISVMTSISPSLADNPNMTGVAVKIE